MLFMILSLFPNGDTIFGLRLIAGVNPFTRRRPTQPASTNSSGTAHAVLSNFSSTARSGSADRAQRDRKTEIFHVIWRDRFPARSSPAEAQSKPDSNSSNDPLRTGETRAEITGSSTPQRAASGIGRSTTKKLKNPRDFALITRTQGDRMIGQSIAS
jgi:hypothetical protein